MLMSLPHAAWLISCHHHVPHAVDEVAASAADDVLKPSKFAERYNVTQHISASNTQLVLQGILDGPEHVAIRQDEAAPSQQGEWQLWTATKNGTVYSVPFVGLEVQAHRVQEQVYAGPGRVLGFAWHTQGDQHGGRARLYLCNSLQAHSLQLPADALTCARTCSI